MGVAVLGGSFGLPHAETHAVMLPHTIGFNASAAGALLDPVREIFGDADVGRGLAAFADQVGAPRALRDLGMAEADLGRAAATALLARIDRVQRLRNKIARARLQGIVAKYGWTLWGCIQNASCPIEYDFWEWAMERYDAAIAEFNGPDFARLLADVTRTD